MSARPWNISRATRPDRFPDAMKITSFQAANFTGYIGERFRFQTLDDNGEAMGPILTGEVKRVFRQGRQISVELYIPDKHCTHIYEAKRIYYKGAANK